METASSNDARRVTSNCDCITVIYLGTDRTACSSQYVKNQHFHETEMIKCIGGVSHQQLLEAYRYIQYTIFGLYRGCNVTWNT